jgi:hypothetical protein
VSVFLVIERPDHGPRVLGTFGTRQDAEVARESLVAEEPGWESFVSIRAAKRSLLDDQRSARGFVGLWLVALLLIDALLVYALYLAVRALAGLA